MDQRALGSAVVETTLSGIARIAASALTTHPELDLQFENFLVVDREVEFDLLELRPETHRHRQKVRPVVPQLRVRAHLGTASATEDTRLNAAEVFSDGEI